MVCQRRMFYPGSAKNSPSYGGRMPSAPRFGSAAERQQHRVHLCTDLLQPDRPASVQRPCEKRVRVPTCVLLSCRIGTWARRIDMTAHLQPTELTSSNEAQRLAALRRYDILDTPP